MYLADKEIGCDDFPFIDNPDRFPPLPVEEGALIMLRFRTDSSGERVDFTSFDILTIDTENGTGTDAVVGNLMLVSAPATHSGRRA